MEASTGSQPRRGEIGQQTFEQVQRLIKSGMKPTEAFSHVAGESGRSQATVATAYYRAARRIPDSGVKHRTRRKNAATTTRPRATPAAGKTTQSLIRDLLDAANALARHAEKLEGDVSTSRRDSAAWAEIQRLVQSR